MAIERTAFQSSMPVEQKPEYRRVWACDGWTLVPARGSLFGNDAYVSITKLEAGLLTVLIMRSTGDDIVPPIISRDVLYQWLWGDIVVEYDNAIDKLTCSLRRKLGRGVIFQVLPRRGLALLDTPVEVGVSRDAALRSIVAASIEGR